MIRRFIKGSQIVSFILLQTDKMTRDNMDGVLTAAVTSQLWSDVWNWEQFKLLKIQNLNDVSLLYYHLMFLVFYLQTAVSSLQYIYNSLIKNLSVWAVSSVSSKLLAPQLLAPEAEHWQLTARKSTRICCSQCHIYREQHRVRVLFIASLLCASGFQQLIFIVGLMSCQPEIVHLY